MSAELEAQVAELRAVVTSLARRQQDAGNTYVRRVTSSTTNTTNNTTTVQGFTLIDEEVLADSGSYAGASGDWNALDLSSLIPATATKAYVRFSGQCLQNTEAIRLQVRADSGAATRTPLNMAAMQSDDDTASDDNAEWIPLTDLGFEYSPTYAVTPVWSLTLLGYA